MAVKNYMDLTDLQLYDSLLKQFISKEDAKSLKTVALSENKLLFYTVSEPVGSTTPAYEITLPSADLSGVLSKITGAVTGNVITAGANGAIVDSGTALTDLLTSAEADKKIATAVAAATHLKKEVVSAVPSISDAKDNVMYLVKDANVTGDDKYKIYMKLDSEVVLIDDTSVNLSGYYTTAQVDKMIDDAKTAVLASAVQSAIEKADAALATAKQYTDTEVGKANTAAKSAQDKADQVGTDLASALQKIQANTDKIENLSGTFDEIGSIKEADIRALFPTT